MLEKFLSPDKKLYNHTSERFTLNNQYLIILRYAYIIVCNFEKQEFLIRNYKNRDKY